MTRRLRARTAYQVLTAHRAGRAGVRRARPPTHQLGRIATPAPPKSLDHDRNWTMPRYVSRHDQPLSRDDRVFLWRALTRWYGPISAKAVPIDLLGFTGWVEIDNEIGRYFDGVATGGDCTGLDERDAPVARRNADP